MHAPGCICLSRANARPRIVQGRRRARHADWTAGMDSARTPILASASRALRATPPDHRPSSRPRVMLMATLLFIIHDSAGRQRSGVRHPMRSKHTSGAPGPTLQLEPSMECRSVEKFGRVRCCTHTPRGHHVGLKDAADPKPGQAGKVKKAGYGPLYAHCRASIVVACN